MSFVYEVISEEDNQKYKIAELLKRYHGVPYRHFSSKWTIDRDANAYLLFLYRGMEEFGNNSKHLLFFNGIEVLIDLELVSYSESTESSNLVWKLDYAEFLGSHSISDEKLMNLLKRSLIAYQRGSSRKVEKHHIEIEILRN